MASANSDRLESDKTAALVAPDCRGMNFYRIDRGLRDLLNLHMEPRLRAAMEPHLERLGELAGGRLDELAEIADKHPPVLHARDRFGRDEDWVEFHPAYREMERIGFGEFGLHAMAHRPGVLGWPEPLPYIAKYAFQYLFVQAEFGLMCPISVTDTGAVLVENYGSDDLKARYLGRMLSQNMDEIFKGAQYMTERAGGSDLGNSAVVAKREGDFWRLYGDKWFCSAVDGDVVLLLARPDGAAAGSRGLGLFLMPRRLENGERNNYRIARLKDKFGTRSMASGEVVLEGAIAYQLGALDRGLRQMMDMVNLSRMSHGARAAGMMRRCLNESLQVARHRAAFGRPIIEHPLLRRQLMKLMVRTEQALSVFTYDATMMDRARAGDAEAERVMRILTAVLKFRACRDNIRSGNRRDGGARRQRLHRGLGQFAPHSRRAYRRAVGGHQQYQRARRDQSRGREIGRARDARARAESQTAGGNCGARGISRRSRGFSRSRSGIRRRGRSQAAA